jgi:anti-sigma B factor antagonist
MNAHASTELSRSTPAGPTGDGSADPWTAAQAASRVEPQAVWSQPGTRTQASPGTSDLDAAFRCVLTGELDYASRDHLLAISRDFGTSGLARAEVDVSGVTFVDSTALAMLLSMRSTATDRGGCVVLVGPGRRLRRLLSLAGVAALFSVEEAPD